MQGKPQISSDQKEIFKIKFLVLPQRKFLDRSIDSSCCVNMKCNNMGHNNFTAVVRRQERKLIVRREKLSERVLAFSPVIAARLTFYLERIDG